MVDPFASAGGIFPIFRFAEVMDPPRKSLALRGSRFVDSALFIFEKDAIVGGGLVEKCVLPIDEPSVFLLKFFDGDPKVAGKAI
jgi:hypothetical protein